VEDDDYSNLCNHAGTLVDIVFVPTVLHYPGGAKLVETILRWVAPLVPILVAKNPNSFCSGGGGSLDVSGLGVGPDTKLLTQTLCGKITDVDAQEECNSGVGSAIDSLGSSSALASKKPVSKRIYSAARHGNDYFATWAFTETHYVDDDRHAERGVDVAIWSHAPPGGSELRADILDRRMREVQVAKSEFYYDPRRGGPRDWSGVKAEAMWNLRWRARLRRVSQPNAALARFFAGPGLGPIVASTAGSGADVSGIVTQVLVLPPEVLAQWTEINVGKVDQTRRTGGIVH
jgi:hypothetical protein